MTVSATPLGLRIATILVAAIAGLGGYSGALAQAAPDYVALLALPTAAKPTARPINAAIRCPCSSLPRRVRA